MIINAILIDPTRQVVEAIQMDNSLKGFYNAIQCKCISSYGVLTNGDVATGDDHALLKGPTHLFWFNRYPIPLGGRVVITGLDQEGECLSCRSSVEYIKGFVRFIPHEQTEMVFEQHHRYLC